MTEPTLTDRFPDRAGLWRLRTRTLRFTETPLLMGIVNVTPDSFSDGGKYAEPAAAIERALKLVEDGADLLDIGGESTRPYADPVEEAEEARRVIPVIKAVAQKTKTPISVDTSKAGIAKQAIDAGAQVVNDVTGLTGDPGMLGLVASSSVGVCAMHMRGNPRNMQDNPAYEDLMGQVSRYLAERRDALIAGGVQRDRICLDPGVGFGKTHQHNVTLLAGANHFHDLGCPVLVGHSQKGFLGKLIGDSEADRTLATVGAALSLARQGVQIIRVHDVRPVREALLAFVAAGGVDGSPGQLDD